MLIMDFLRVSRSLGMLSGKIHYFRSAGFLLTIQLRWGTIPVVKVAQEEKFIDLPPELELPWFFLRRRYGITSQGGNVTSNFLYNFNKEGQIVYEINCGMPEIIKSAEYNFAHIFALMEKLVCARIWLWGCASLTDS